MQCLNCNCSQHLISNCNALNCITYNQAWKLTYDPSYHAPTNCPKKGNIPSRSTLQCRSFLPRGPTHVASSLMRSPSSLRSTYMTNPYQPFPRGLSTMGHSLHSMPVFRMFPDYYDHGSPGSIMQNAMTTVTHGIPTTSTPLQIQHLPLMIRKRIKHQQKYQIIQNEQ